MKLNFKLFPALAVVLTAVYLTGCVNYDQKTTLSSDGSGSMKIHYWTKMSNFSMGTTLGRFEFDEAKAKDQYTHSNLEVKSLKVEDELADSVKHVRIELSFKDINKLSEAKGFNNVKTSWKESTDGMELKYTLMKDTAAAKNMGASENTVTYTFEMPDEIISTNASKKDGKNLTWDFKVSDLSKDIEMTANAKGSSKKFCGLFGFIAGAMLIGLAYYTQSNRRKMIK